MTGGRTCPECGGNVTIDEMRVLTDEDGNAEAADVFSCEGCGAGGSIGVAGTRTGIFAEEDSR